MCICTTRDTHIIAVIALRHHNDDDLKNKTKLYHNNIFTLPSKALVILPNAGDCVIISKAIFLSDVHGFIMFRDIMVKVSNY